ncbi:MAG: hypothetical protein E7570_07235 [Ruminococcaceae bacterium]|nr:hypothetical protein [Oscillospiraceae bacterium]
MFDKHYVQKTKIIDTINDLVSEYKLKKSNTRIVDKIYKKSLKVIKKLTISDIYNEMQTNNVPIELVALNILQNCAMLYIKPAKSFKDMLIEKDEAKDFFDYINDKKYDNGLITEEQYEENKLVGTKLLTNNLTPFSLFN